jgi:hypothetical protein
LSEQQLEIALQAVLDLKDYESSGLIRPAEEMQAEVLAALASRLPRHLLEKALRATLRPTDHLNQVQALVQLIVCVSHEKIFWILERALEMSLEQTNEQKRRRMLTTLAPHLKGHLLERALEAAMELQSEWEKRTAVMALAPHLNWAQLKGALQATLHFEIPEQHTGKQIPDLDERQCTWLLEQELEDIFALSSNMASKKDRLLQIAPLLTGSLLDRALQVATTQRDLEKQAEILVALAPRLSTEQLTKALEHLLQDALAKKREFTIWGNTMKLDPPDKRALASVLVILANQWTDQLLEQALQAALMLFDRERAHVLVRLAPRLSGELLEQALQAALALPAETGYRVQALAVLAPQLSKEQHFRMLDQALQEALAENNAKKQADTLAILLPFTLDHSSIRKSIQRIVLDFTLQFKHHSRHKMFESCFDENGFGKLFMPPIFSSETLRAIALHIISICSEWQWL